MRWAQLVDCSSLGMLSWNGRRAAVIATFFESCFLTFPEREEILRRYGPFLRSPCLMLALHTLATRFATMPASFRCLIPNVARNSAVPGAPRSVVTRGFGGDCAAARLVCFCSEHSMLKAGENSGKGIIFPLWSLNDSRTLFNDSGIVPPPVCHS